ncbi:hypothetical protein SASPL_120545 [Salvia splendens]|uniref:Uncharacterized protein n=1 Tax=Salvia splendens TaxID=180675 RepID=A0A8X8XT70_SALSN|nr:hypothetical protein SASPL_120545 [Salvia splendens]
MEDDGAHGGALVGRGDGGDDLGDVVGAEEAVGIQKVLLVGFIGEVGGQDAVRAALPPMIPARRAGLPRQALNMFPYSNEDISVDIEEEEEGSSSGPKSIGKESKGHTYMTDIWGRHPNLPLISVEYNEFDRPIGGEKE